MINIKKNGILVALAVSMLCGTLAGCDKNKTASIDLENPTINIMSMAYNTDSAPADSPVLQELENYVGAKLNFNWIPTSGYDEKVTTTMGAGVYPHVMLINKVSSSVIQASRNDIFWDLTDKLTDAEKFPNLAQSDPNINHNISIDGHVYGIYRARELGRSGIIIRKDWLDNLGLDMPETIDDLYNVLRAFTYDDPDQNGEDDTYGMIVTTYLEGPLDNLAIWMGAPNQWGVNKETGELEPDFMTPEYLEALKFIRKCYEEGLINADMATYDPERWNEQFLSGKAGVIIDQAGRARRIAENMQNLDSKAVVDVVGYVKKDENSEPKTRPTTGYSGYYVIPKASVKTEEELDCILKIIDKSNDIEALNLMNYGIRDRNYTVIDDIYADKKEDAALKKEYNDLNQFSTILSPSLKTKYTSNLAEKIEVIQEENKKYVVTNIAEPYVSNTYATKGPQLDAIMNLADTQFMVGQITEEDYKKEIERWKDNGGTQVIAEMNEAYQNDDLVQK